MEITESVLTSVKKLLGIDEGYTHFDADIVMHINSVFSILTQMGVGPANGFSITGKDEGWIRFHFWRGRPAPCQILCRPEGAPAV